MYAAKQAGRNCTRTWKHVCPDNPQSAPPKQDPEVNQLQHQVASLSLQAKDIFVQGTWGLIRALEARDCYTRCHSENVTVYAVGIAEAMGLEPEEVAVIRRAANVHDIGKIGVSDIILLKPGPLTNEERDIMRKHVLIGVQILDQMKFLEREIPLVRHHHEFWNGKGYPYGIAGTAIPLGARIMAVADALDAITSDRVYRKGVDVSRAVRILKEESGRQFDPASVEALIRWLREQGGLPFSTDETAGEEPRKIAAVAGATG
jgi:putative nucleotidyltransferase with HDIG domain